MSEWEFWHTVMAVTATVGIAQIVTLILLDLWLNRASSIER